MIAKAKIIKSRIMITDRAMVEPGFDVDATEAAAAEAAEVVTVVGKSV